MVLIMITNRLINSIKICRLLGVKPNPRLLRTHHFFISVCKPTFTFSYLQRQQRMFSSFKDDFTQQELKSGMLKQFETHVSNFEQAYDAGKYEEARQHLEKSAELMRKVNCHNSIQYVEILLNIVATTKKYQFTERTISALEEADAILSELPDKNYTHKQIVYIHLSHEYDVKKDAAKTIIYLSKLLKLFEATGVESDEILALYEKVGQLCIHQHRLEDSIPYFKKILSLLQGKEKDNTREYLKALDDLSFVEYNLGKYDQVLEYRMKALQIEESLSGKASANYISHLKNIGLIHKKQKQFQLYVHSLQEALDLAVTSKLQSTPVANEIKENLGLFYLTSTQQYEKALPLLQSALLSLSLESEEDKYLYFTRAVAQCHKQIKQFQLCKQKLLQVLAVLQKKEVKSCQYAYVMSQVGLAYYNLEQYEPSLQYYLKSLAIEEEKHGPESETCLQLYQNVAELYYLLNNTRMSDVYLGKIDQYKDKATKSH